MRKPSENNLRRASINRMGKNKAQGFTLVELLVVMLVLVALSSITLDFTKDFAFQGRYEVTKDRYEKNKERDYRQT